ncbi:MAG: hypothetical protein HYX20_02570 [Candidatus Yanofskybacteria bacterium]|nr:hypothetical protein [Candidatus Yanofskybacteria bacterium]
MSNQFELFDIKPKKNPKTSKRESLKRKARWLGENLKEFIRETRVEHVCARCGQPIEKGSSVIKLTPLEKGKLVIGKIDYFHRKSECPESRLGE